MDSASSASAGGDALLQEQIEDQIEEIQVLFDESEGHRLSGVNKDRKNTELTNQVKHLKEELGEIKAKTPATGSATWAGFPWTGTGPSPVNSSGEPASGTTGSGGAIQQEATPQPQPHQQQEQLETVLLQQHPSTAPRNQAPEPRQIKYFTAAITE